MQGAVVANHVSVSSIIKVKDEKTGQEVCAGAHLKDELTGETFQVKAKVKSDWDDD